LPNATFRGKFAIINTEPYLHSIKAKKGSSVPDAVQNTTTKVSAGQQKLAVKLLTYVLMFSFFVTLATSAYIIYSDYLQGANEFNQSISQIEAGYQESISYSLWNFDSQQIKTQLAGILNFPGVLNVYIETKEGLLHSSGDFEQTGSQKHAFDLFFTSAERQYPLGVLNINLDYKGLYEALFYKALNILATQFIKTFSVSLFILFIFQRLVTHRLLSMSQWANNFSLNDLDRELTLNSSDHSNKQDEIDSVVNAINSMRISLKEDIKKRELTELALNKSQYKLSIAINNAELGFCEYSQKTDRFSGNEHFSRHLGLDPGLLEKIEHPIDWFKNHIVGDRTIEQRERINQLLHGHMERICTELSIQCSENSIKHFDTTVQVSEWDDNGLPITIVFCILDKTEQVNASKQAADLNYALEQKVTKRTEELTNEQVQSKAEIKKLQQQLVNFEQQKRRQQSQENLLPLQDALAQLQKLIHPSQGSSNDSEEQRQLQQAKLLIELLAKHLQASNKSSSQTFDVVGLIQESLQGFLTEFKFESATKLRLPFSLMLDSHKDLLTYCFEHCLTTIQALSNSRFNSENLTISLDLKGDHGIIKLDYDGANIITDITEWSQPASNEMIILKMCHVILEERFNGSILVTQDTNFIGLELRFSINASC
jgi:HAMP domain-containing protein